jgi:pimeloyl-ACP methyl ester carboxylesterase
MPYADNGGVGIHYEVEGNGRPLVLQHGFTDTLEAWSDFGYVEPLREHYRRHCHVNLARRACGRGSLCSGDYAVARAQVSSCQTLKALDRISR